MERQIESQKRQLESLKAEMKKLQGERDELSGKNGHLEEQIEEYKVTVLISVVALCHSWKHEYSKISVIRSPVGLMKIGHNREVVSLLRVNSCTEKN